MTQQNPTDKTPDGQAQQTADTADIAQQDAAEAPEMSTEPAGVPSDAAGENAAGLEDPLAAMTAERDQLKEQLLRALADTENMRRRAEREAASVRKYGHTPFARDLVGALDNLGRAVDSTPEDLDTVDEPVKSLLTGIQLSWTELQSVIQKHGIERVSPKGEKFDYNFHQAMFEVPTDDMPSGMVVEVVQHGYVLHDRLLRPAMVGVSKAAAAESASPAEKGEKEDKA
jgi:molecular chaperone GrpE